MKNSLTLIGQMVTIPTLKALDGNKTRADFKMVVDSIEFHITMYGEQAKEVHRIYKECNGIGIQGRFFMDADVLGIEATQFVTFNNK